MFDFSRYITYCLMSNSIFSSLISIKIIFVVSITVSGRVSVSRAGNYDPLFIGILHFFNIMLYLLYRKLNLSAFENNKLYERSR